MIDLLAALPLLVPALFPAQGQGRPAVPPIQDLGDTWLLSLEESGDSELTLERLVKITQEVTGINFTYTKETGQLLASVPVRMFGPKEIPKRDFYAFFQILMIINEYVTTRIGPDHLSVVVVQSLKSPARTTMRQDAVYVDPQEIETYADQPATLITTVLSLPNTDVRTLSNSLRPLIVDPNTLTILPVGNNNLILQGFGSQIAALARMMYLVDDASRPVDVPLPEFEVVPLEYASAQEIASMIEELLDASRRAAQSSQRSQPQVQGATAPIPRQESETKILVDPRTNSLLVMAMADQMPRIKELVARLDVDIVERERNYHFVALQNADATQTAEVLENFLRDAARVQPTQAAGQPQTGRVGGGGSSGTDVVVVPSPATNSLLIAANRTRYEEIYDLIQRLDMRQDQVLIETALIELSGSDVLNLGVELGGADFGDNNRGPWGLTSFGLGSFVDTNNDGIPDVKVPNVAQGVTAGILSGEDFNLPILLAALRDKRNTNVLNIPSVLVANNGTARVLTLDQQPTTQITATGVGGQTQENFASYQEAGITLEISPAISASRYLRLKIYLEVSSFLGSFSGPIPPPKITRTIDTTVNVPSGDTMVIGGIIVDNKGETTRRVPFLGDIPLLGRLFRSDSSSKDRTTLYFFVTPHIMQDRDFADLAEYSYRKKLDAADTIGASRVQLIDPKFGRAGAKDFGGGFEVPLYQAPARGQVDATQLGLDPSEVQRMLREEAAAGGSEKP